MKKREWSFSDVLQFLHKRKTKICNIKCQKKFINKIFLFVRTDNLNWETLTKILVISLKDGMGLRMKNFDIKGGSLKNLNIYGGFTKNQYIAGNYLKSRLVQFADLI